MTQAQSIKKFLALFNKVGGKEILKQYLRGRVLLFALVQTLMQGFSKKSLEIVRLSVNNKILCKLRKKYAGFIKEFQAAFREEGQKTSNKVWVCWLQGIEQAPELVQACYASLQMHLKDREIILLTRENYRQYIQLPEFIEEKARRGIISHAHYADLMRLELLLKHGGTWIDATVLCTGGEIPGYMLDSRLFMFQNLKPGLDGHPTSVSNWFITACAGHPLLRLTQALLYEYWRKHDKLVDYFIFHDFFQLAIEAYPEQWDVVVPFSNAVPHILLLRMFDRFNAETFRAITEMSPFHKLSYKFDPEKVQQEGTYYRYLIAK